jgi:O-antigen ligase
LAAGCLLLLVAGRHASDTGPLLKVAFWSGAVMAGTGFVFALATSGALGEWAVDAINMVPGVDRVNKPAYLGSGFVALTNWHQDPGYAALWSNVWLLLAGFAWIRGEVRGPRWLGPGVLGGLGAVTILTLSRTGWFGLVVSFACLLGAHAGGGERRSALRLVLGSIVVMVAVLGAQLILDREGVGGDWTASLEFRLSHLWVLGAIDLGEIGVEDPDLVVGDNRLEVWGEYWERFLNQPLRGIGLGTGWAEEGLQEPHNLGLQVLAETGIVGLLGLAALLISLVVTAGKPDPLAGSVLVVVALAALTQTVIFEPVLWFGLGLWLAHALKREAERPVLSVT